MMPLSWFRVIQLFCVKPPFLFLVFWKQAHQMRLISHLNLAWRSPHRSRYFQSGLLQLGIISPFFLYQAFASFHVISKTATTYKKLKASSPAVTMFLKEGKITVKFRYSFDHSLNVSLASNQATKWVLMYLNQKFLFVESTTVNCFSD